MELRIGICVPAFDNPETVSSVVKECLDKYSNFVLVVDDGSSIPVESILSQNIPEAIESGRVEILRLKTNQGKGIAIQEGFKTMLAKGLTHMVTIDADGQHPPCEINTLIIAAKNHPWALIIGNRIMEESHIPRLSKFGKGFSNFWVKFETDVGIKDSQSGLRCYPLFHVQNLTFFTRRYDFELEVLIRLIWKKVEVVEIPVRVFYPPAEQRVSHFRKIRDNLRITILNILFISLSLLKGRISPSKAGLALGVGAFVGCLPLYGLHTFIVVGLSVLFRLNFLLLLLGTMVSIPPLILVITALSYTLGTKAGMVFMSGTQTELSALSSLSKLIIFLFGSVMVAGLAGIIAFGIGVVLSKRFSSKTKKNWTGKSRGGILGNKVIKAILKVGGVPAGYLCLCGMVPYFYFFAPKATRASHEYWRILYPNERFLKRAFRVLAHYYKFGQVLMDKYYYSEINNRPFTIQSEGFDKIRESLTGANGLVVVTAHVGAWQIALGKIKARGFKRNIQTVEFRDTEQAKQEKGEKYHKLKDSLYTNEHNFSVLEIYKTLNNGFPVGIMGDRPTLKHCELVLFLGKLTPFDITPFKVAKATKKQLVYSFGVRIGYKNYKLMTAIADVSKGELDDVITDPCLLRVCDFASGLEAIIRKYPDQWFNFYSVWSLVPN